jgi:D-3-phosphoglycerate dehydrogenase
LKGEELKVIPFPFLFYIISYTAKSTARQGVKLKILISDPFSKELPGMLAKFGEVSNNKTSLHEAEIVLVRSATKVTPEFVDSAPNLKLVIRGGVGIDNIDVEYCEKKGITVQNTPEASAIAVAELTIALMLAISRKIVYAHNTTKAGEWRKKELKGTELYGKTLGLVGGAGRIAIEVAKRAQAFGMNLFACDICGRPLDYAELMDTDELFIHSDIISLHTPLTHDTKDIIKKKNLDKMKANAILINTARGELVVEEDLYDALKSGKIAYAGLDVYRTEPLKESPLFELDNVLLTPHIGAQTYENMDRIGEEVIALIKEFVESGE